MAKKATSKAPILFPDAFQLAANLEFLANRNGTTLAELAKAAGGISDNTLRKRRREPWTWSMDELSGIARLWNMSVPQLMVAPKFETPELLY